MVLVNVFGIALALICVGGMVGLWISGAIYLHSSFVQRKLFPSLTVRFLRFALGSFIMLAIGIITIILIKIFGAFS